MNKNFIKYFLPIILVIIFLITLLFLEKSGSIIPNIYGYLDKSNIDRDINGADQYVVNLGYFGSFLSGSLGLIFTLASLIFLGLTFLDQSRKSQISEIENRIFKLIEVLVEIKNQNLLSDKSKTFLDNNKTVSDLDFFKNELKKNHLDFSNFFRMLYQILKYINNNESNISNKFSKKSVDPKVKDYTNIIRSYLDTDLLTCLAINCYCLDSENGEYDKYKKLLERYEFFEHLPNYLPIQFSSYIYYDIKAFGKNTWFNSFQKLREDILEVSKTYNTKDFCTIFLYILSKKNGVWSNDHIKLKVEYGEQNHNFYLELDGIESLIIDKNINFEISKSNNYCQVIQSPHQIEKDDHKSEVYKDKCSLVLKYIKNNSDKRYVDIINLYFTLKDKNTLELETNVTNDKP